MAKIALGSLKGPKGDDGDVTPEALAAKVAAEAARTAAATARDAAVTARNQAVAAAESVPTEAELTATIAAAIEAPFDPADVGYDIIPILGQSNNIAAPGINRDYFDGPDSRVFQFANLTSIYPDQVVAAIEPLFHHETREGNIGYPLTFAKLYASTAPVTRRVLLVPCAHGDTGFGSTGTYTWRVGQTGPINLYSLAVAQINKALALPGKNRIAAVLWHQGEANNNQAAGSYAADLDAVITDLRTRYGATIPFVLGQMSPVKIAQNPSTYGVIDGVHRATPTRKPYIGFWESVPLLESDNLHFSAAGQRINGRTAFKAYALARTEAGGVVASPAIPVPAQVVGVSASPTETAVSLSWTATLTATGYVAQYRVAGGSAWATGATVATPAATISGLTAGTAYEFRVAATNSGGTGTYSATTTATTQAPVPGFTDTFTRANAATLGSTNDGKAWEAFGSSGTPAWKIESNAAGYAGGSARSIAVVNALTADGVLKDTIQAIGVAAGGIVGRGVDANNYLAVMFRQTAGTNRLRLVKRVAGTETLLGTSAAGKLAADGGVVELVLAGSSVSVKLNGEEVIAPVTVTDFAAATKHGLIGDPGDTALLHGEVVFTP